MKPSGHGMCGLSPFCFILVAVVFLLPAQTRGQDLSSPMTVTEEAVAAVDNIPPAPVTNVSVRATDEGHVLLTWTLSADDRVVGFVHYMGFAIPIAGVEHYEIFRCHAENAWMSIARVPGGTNSYVDRDLPAEISSLGYRVDALDRDNRTLGALGVLPVAPRVRFLDKDGNRVYVVTPRGATPLTPDFEDFIAFAAAFNSTTEDPNYNVFADTNEDEVINFSDFINFARTFGQQAEASHPSGVPCAGY